MGSKVVLSPTFRDCEDADGGPLQPGDVGTVFEDDGSSKPYHVRAANGNAWWYTAAALQAAPATSAAQVTNPHSQILVCVSFSRL